MYLQSKYEQFKAQFNIYFQHTKKVKALENYAEVAHYSGAKYIRILKELIKDGFLEPEEETFLNYQLKKTEINYLFWSHKTKLLKKEMRRIAKSKVSLLAPKQLYFDIDKPRDTNPFLILPLTNLIASKQVHV
jgi:hypothetical protein